MKAHNRIGTTGQIAMLAWLCLLLCGCGNPTRSPNESTGVVVAGQRINAPNATAEVFIYVIELNGHRFAIAAGANGSGICEVTDASLVKTNAEAK